MVNYQTIFSQKSLTQLVSELRDARKIAVDLEADSLFHYRERVCLIQLAANHHHWVIDPLTIDDLTPLLPIFADPSIEKIFHGADYDIRSLYRDFGITITNLFDTELACRFLGMSHTGLAHILAERFQVRLDKKFQRKDWSKRPLPVAMLDYATEDVAHLIALADVLKKELKEAGRDNWVREECHLLAQVRPAEPNQGPLFVKFGGAGKFDHRSLAVLEALLVLRDELAQKKDRPVFKIMSHATLYQLALEKPNSNNVLKRTRALSRKQMAMYANKIIAAVRKAMTLSSEALPVYPHVKKVDRENGQLNRIKALKRLRDRKARQLDLPPGLLISNARLGAIAIANPSSKKALAAVESVRTWQVALLGDDILAILMRSTENPVKINHSN